MSGQDRIGKPFWTQPQAAPDATPPQGQSITDLLRMAGFKVIELNPTRINLMLTTSDPNDPCLFCKQLMNGEDHAHVVVELDPYEHEFCCHHTCMKKARAANEDQPIRDALTERYTRLGIEPPDGGF